jgi:hypothetical protein
VRLGGQIGAMRIVLSGLAAKDRVVVNGVRKIFFPGMPVAPQLVPMDSPDYAPPPPAAEAGAEARTAVKIDASRFLHRPADLRGGAVDPDLHRRRAGDPNAADLSEYPDVVPPTVQVRAVYPGANPTTVADRRRAARGRRSTASTT